MWQILAENGIKGREFNLSPDRLDAIPSPENFPAKPAEFFREQECRLKACSHERWHPERYCHGNSGLRQGDFPSPDDFRSFAEKFKAAFVF